MAIKITTWRPDTCGCTVEYSWDDAVPLNLRVHTFSALPVKCSIHEPLADSDVFGEINKENPLKNKALSEILETVPSHAKQITDADGNISKEFIKGKEPVITFDDPEGGKNRQLVLSFSQMTPQEKTTAQGAIDATVGIGKAFVE